MAERPDPMTPPEIDLRGFEYMPLDTTRLLDSDLFALSTGEEFKAAVALWCKAWHQVPAASLPADERVLAHLSGAGPRWSKVRAIALRGWVECSDGRLYHPLIAEKAIDAWASRVKHEAKREAERKRLQEWREKRKRNADETRTETVDETRTKLVGEGEGERTPLEPPLAAVLVAEVRSPGGEPPSPAPRGSRIPDGFPGDAEIAWCRSERADLDPAQTAAKFRDYWIGVPGAKARKVDWPATWRNFVRGERQPLRATGTLGRVVAHPSSATPDEAVMRRISEANGGQSVIRLPDGRLQCGVHYYRPNGQQEVAL